MSALDKINDFITSICKNKLMLKKTIRIIFIFSAYLCFLSCQSAKKRTWTSADLIISDKSSFESLVFPPALSAQQEAEDIDFLIYALSKGYGGRLYMPEDALVKAFAELNKISTVSSIKEFHNQIDDALFFIPDNHLMAYYKGNVGRKRSAQDETGHVGTNNISDRHKVWESRIDHVGKKKVLYISIVRFPNSEDKIWNGFISSVSSRMRSANSIVIDLRGNSGGDDTKGMELAELLFGHPFEHPIKRQYRSQTPETLALAVNLPAVQIINLKYGNKKIPEYIVNELNYNKERYHMAAKGQIPTEFVRTDKGSGDRAAPVNGYKKPIYILMDKACVSSCEFTIAAFEWHNKVQRVGENTSGTFHFSNKGMAILPNSKIKVMIPTQYSEYYDRRFIERIGFSPDIKVELGQDAYDITKKIISTRFDGD